jgi:hypothetical protein
MPINVATVRTAARFPELLPDVNIMNGVAGLELAALDLRRFGNRILRLNDINVEQNANVELRVFNDKEKYYINTFGLRNRLVEPFNIYSTDFIRMALMGVAAPIVNYRINYNLWVLEPTTAHKLKHGINLTTEDEEILKTLDIRSEVNKGNLPLPIEYQLEREYQLVDGRRTFTYNGNALLTEQVLQTIPSNINEFIVLESVSAAPNAIADNVRIRIDRDDDIDYIELNTHPMQLNVPVACFIPALREIKFKVIGGAMVATQLQWTISRYKLTDVLNVRFGLVTREETDPDLWNKVKGGVY